MTAADTESHQPAQRSFAALRDPGFRPYFLYSALAMMADSVEHVISYWMMFQKFHSPALAGFAVLSHWLPFLFFSVAVGGLSDRFDPRRIIQCGMLLFIVASCWQRSPPWGRSPQPGLNQRRARHLLQPPLRQSMPNAGS